MNLLGDDTRLETNQYTVGFNLRNRNDVLDTILGSTKDVAAPVGIKQGILTFGNYIILFVAGKAYYRYYTATGWQLISGFSMSITNERLWTATVPVSLTNYARIGIKPTTGSTVADPYMGVYRSNSIIGAAQGNNPGLLVQDNVSQPQFIYLDQRGIPICRTTQNYGQWAITIDPVTFIVTADAREYVPIGNNMAWVDGVLYITSQDGNFIYRSVSGRPLDFVINVDADGQKGGDATTTSYSVGVGGISCLREMSNGGLFVAASNANFMVTKNTSEIIPTIFGEFTLIRRFLFNATCLSDRVIIDSLGDTRFIDLTGIRSFNAINQDRIVGRNSVFSSTIQTALTKLPSSSTDLIQDPRYSAAMLYDNYELYAIDTIFGPAIAVYDTINSCWTSFDIGQTGGKRIKQFAKIELTIQRLYAITEDDELYTLYIGPDKAVATVRTISVSRSVITQDGQTVKQNIPKSEVKIASFRCIVNRITKNCSVTVTPFINNRLTLAYTQTKNISYVSPVTPYTGDLELPDIDTQLNNLLFTLMEAGQGWKCFILLSWTEGQITQYSMELTDVTPMNPQLSQGVAV